jgi:uncharacterized protein YjbI with pentapeptide repeats
MSATIPANPPQRSQSWIGKILPVVHDKDLFDLLELLLKIAAVIGVLYGAFTFVGESEQRRQQAANFEAQTVLLQTQVRNSGLQTRSLQEQTMLLDRQVDSLKRQELVAKIQMHLLAWQAIADAATHGDSSDRRESLEFLAADHVAMLGMHADYAHLLDIKLNGAELGWSHFVGTDLSGAQFSRASLQYADLRGVRLIDADLRGVYMVGANLSCFRNEQNQLGCTIMSNVDLRCIRGRSQPAVSCANLSGAHIDGAVLRNARLGGARLYGTNLKDSDLRGSTGIPMGATQAVWSNTICPDGTNSNADRLTCSGHFLPAA